MWYTLARPQEDGSDIPLLSELEHNRIGWTKAPRIADATPSLLQGTIGVYAGPNPRRKNYGFGIGTSSPRSAPEDITAAWLSEFEPYISTWDVGRRALESFVDEWWCYELANREAVGCSSGHVEMVANQYPYHAVCVTRSDNHGAAQGIYHEYAHLRLEAMGVMIETHDGTLLLNADTELYTSSVRSDKPCPMSAVLHGVYAWLMLTENDYQLHARKKIFIDELILYSERNLTKIQKGIATIKEYGRFTPAGEDFIRGVYEWADDLCARYATLF